MTDKKKMTRTQEYEFYSDDENQEPQGAGRRRKAKLTEMVPVRLSEETIEDIRKRADADDRSVSGWIRRAVERELKRDAG